MKRWLDPSREDWMRADETRAVLAALMHAEGSPRFVGGAVRNALLERPVSDIDIATPLVPEEVMRCLGSAHIDALPTGIEHGTITAVVNGKHFEVTTLRRDVATDGRRAVVVFSRDWAEDARRRDFTINALYAAPDGEIFDFTTGFEDLERGRVRFIGDATTRIREDYLRILRLFRFHAWYGKGDIDADGLRAAAAERTGLRNLSGERVQKELLRLLEADAPGPPLRAMAAAGILGEILPGALQFVGLERLAAIDCANFFPPDAMLRLAALTADEPRRASSVAERLKLSNEGRARLEDIAGADERIVSYLSVREVHRLLYRLGPARFKDRIFLRWAQDPKPSSAIGWRALLALADGWAHPRFPLSGRDVMAAGVPEGPLVGRILSDVETWWVEGDFTADEFSLAERLKAVVQATAH